MRNKQSERGSVLQPDPSSGFWDLWTA